jgi:hypothetical protein
MIPPWFFTGRIFNAAGAVVTTVVYTNHRRGSKSRSIFDNADYAVSKVPSVVFAVFSNVCLKEDFRWNCAVSFLMILGAVFFMFKRW